MLKAAYSPYRLLFKEPAMTSRDTMTSKQTYFIKIWDDSRPDVFGLGECALFQGLGCDDRPDYEERLSDVCRRIDSFDTYELVDFPSIIFGVETALSDLFNGGLRSPYPGGGFEQGKPIIINGLVWMGDKRQMTERVEEKLKAGFRCVKFKIGGIDFEDEIDMIRSVRSRFLPEDLEIRLDANGGFSPENALERLIRLSEFKIHSIEQPVKPRQWEQMWRLCEKSPIDIALDEELIGINDVGEKAEMLDAVRPAYIILKPSLCGGFSGADEWIRLASERSIGWWATSALESNVGLNAIARWVSGYSPDMPQGLGTGNLYLNNIISPLFQIRDKLVFDPDGKWIMPDFKWIIP